jgi:hypothetical protein
MENLIGKKPAYTMDISPVFSFPGFPAGKGEHWVWNYVCAALPGKVPKLLCRFIRRISAKLNAYN